MDAAESDDLSSNLLTLGAVLRGADVLVGTDPLAEPTSVQQQGLHGHVEHSYAVSPTPLHVEYQLELTEAEVPLFRNYVEDVSHWIDSFSHDRPFHQVVPALALKCPPLLHACLALGSKQIDLVCDDNKSVPNDGRTVGYYRLALAAIGSLLLHDESARSDEVLAACIILSIYEMIDVVGESLNSHLPGVASLLQERQVYGDADGIRGACYWTWYRHEIWAAILSGNCFSVDENSWEPQTLASFEGLTPHQVANRVIFLFGQCIRICNKQSWLGADSSGLGDESEAEFVRMEASLDNWNALLPPHMTHFKTVHDLPTGQLWFPYPQSGQ